jgi:hypothetical protein
MGGNFFSVNRSENPNEQLRDFPLKYIMNDGKGNHLPQTEEKDLWLNKKNEKIT